MSEKDLARAIIKQALKDAVLPRDSQERREGRYFLTGSTKSWYTSLVDICSIAEMNPYTIRHKALEWKEKGWPSSTYINRLIDEKY